MTTTQHGEDAVYTTDDLVAEAHARGFSEVKPRLVVAWTEMGLLCPPEFRKSTRHGSDSRVYSSFQRSLFLTAIEQRDDLVDRRHRVEAMAQIVAWFWVVTVNVPTQQAQRALRTYARCMGRAPKGSSGEVARGVIDALAHPSATRAQRLKAKYVMEQCLRSNQWRWDVVESALTEVISPWDPSMRQHIERGVPSGVQHLAVKDIVSELRAFHGSLTALAAERVDIDQLEEARSRTLQRTGPWSPKAAFTAARVGFPLSRDQTQGVLMIFLRCVHEVLTEQPDTASR